MNGELMHLKQWMASKGAKSLILPSRSGASSISASSAVSELRERGVRVITPKCDVSSPSSLFSMLEDCVRSGVPPIKGCINAAMVLQVYLSKYAKVAYVNLP